MLTFIGTNSVSEYTLTEFDARDVELSGYATVVDVVKLWQYKLGEEDEK